MKFQRILWRIVATFVIGVSSTVHAQAFTNAFYTLVEGSSLVDECTFCGRPTILLPLRGTFELVALPPNPLFARYRLTNINWRAGGGVSPAYQLTGTGEYRVGGEVAVVQDLTLSLHINELTRNFTNATPLPVRSFPIITASLVQTQNTPAQTFTIELAAAPFREIWFSTTSGFTSAYNNLRG
ncbi:MAG: hypothetical protein QOF48_4020, partial [Verrucomicrobiota bacterium]